MDGKINRRKFLFFSLFLFSGCIGSNQSNNQEKSMNFPTNKKVLPKPMSSSKLREKAVSAGPGKDGIPSIDNPNFIESSKADKTLDNQDIVFGVKEGKSKKAYPQSVLVWHEICNDKINGKPVSVTYCPLTGTAMGFERGETTFGVSGRLINNNLIMYDRSTETWWPQILATSIESPWNNKSISLSLKGFRVVWTTWERWKGKYPDTKVLSRDTGFVRNYDRDPYGSYIPTRNDYYALNSPPLYPSLNRDNSYPPKKVFLGGRTSTGAICFLKESLRNKKIMKGELSGIPILAIYDESLDTGYLYKNPDNILFSFNNGVLFDENENRFKPDSLPLEKIISFDVMWFAWKGFYPKTNIYD